MKKLIFMLFFSIGLSAQNFDFECEPIIEWENVIVNLQHDENGTTATLSVTVETPEAHWLPRRFIVNIDEYNHVAGKFVHRYRFQSGARHLKSKHFSKVIPPGRYISHLSLKYRNGAEDIIETLPGVPFTILPPAIISSTKLIKDPSSRSNVTIELETNVGVTGIMGGLQGETKKSLVIGTGQVTRYYLPIDGHDIANRTYEFSVITEDEEPVIQKFVLMRIADVRLTHNDRINVFFRGDGNDYPDWKAYRNNGAREDLHVGFDNLKGKIGIGYSGGNTAWGPDDADGNSTSIRIPGGFDKSWEVAINKGSKFDRDMRNARADIDAGNPVYIWFTKQ